MPWKFNPFSGTLDQAGSGGGGASYIDGEVQYFSDLPQTIGSPSVDSAYLVREAEGTWLLARKPAGIYIRTADSGVRADDWTHASAFPDVFSDANFLLYDNDTPTKNLQFQLSGITTGTTRTLTVPNSSGTISLNGHTHIASDIVFGTFNNDRINWNSPNPIGSSTPSDGTFTTLTANTALVLKDGSDTGTFVAASKLTANRTYDLPDSSGVIALTAQLTDTQIFTANGTWTKPAGAKLVHYFLIGGGAGGASGARQPTGSNAGGGSGGAGGQVHAGWIQASQLGATESVAIGAGGAGHGGGRPNSSNGGNGTGGGNTTFGSILAIGGTNSNSGASTGGGASSGTGSSINLYYGAIGARGVSQAGGFSANLGENTAAIAQPAGGGGGGGKQSTTYYLGGRGGGVGAAAFGLTQSPAAVANTAGGNGITSATNYFGTGGTGGSPGAGGEANNGGNGGLYGGGGGGGSACDNDAGGVGKGGDGGQGIAIITTYF